MAEPLAASLEFGKRPIVRPRRKTARPGKIAKSGFRFQNLQDIASVVLPIGGEFEASLPNKTFANQGHEIRLHDAALVVTFFGPGIGEIEQYSIQGMRRDTGFQDMDRVPPDNARIGKISMG